MKKIKLSLLICAGFSGIPLHFVLGQGPYTITGDTITFNMVKIPRLGPRGHASFEIGPLDNAVNDENKAYPKIKNKPDNLTNITEYFFILDRLQFYYQSYCAGLYSRDFFLRKTAQLKLNLSDTVRLSKKPIKCAFSVLAGLNANNETVYIIDANNNADFGDDVIKPLLNNLQDQDMIVDAAMPVKINVLSGNELKEETILVLPTGKINEGKIELMFTFPELLYSRFIYEGQPYIICADVFQFSPMVTVMPDGPNFSPVSPGKQIGINQYFQIGNSTFSFAEYAENGNKITLVRGNSENRGKAADIYSNQYGFKAPVIKGYNINEAANNSSFISTAALKGKYIFIDFWSTYCGACILEFPYLREAYQKYDRKQLEIIGVLDERNKDLTEKLLKEHKVIWPNIKTDTAGTEIKGYGNINSFPTSYLIDPEGRIVAVNLRGDELLGKLKTLIR